jgi:hypothetical protein
MYVNPAPCRHQTIALCIEKSWALTVRCNGCDHMTTWWVRDLRTRFANSLGATLDELAARLKCERCGSRDGWIATRNDAGALQARDLERFAAKDRKRDAPTD